MSCPEARPSSGLEVRVDADVGVQLLPEQPTEASVDDLSYDRHVGSGDQIFIRNLHAADDAEPVDFLRSV